LRVNPQYNLARYLLSYFIFIFKMENHTYPTEKFFNKTIVVNKESMFSKDNLLISREHYKYIDKVMLSRGTLIDRTEKLAEMIVKDYYDKTVYFLVILKGAITFGSILADKISDILKTDVTNSYSMKYYFEYISLSSYENDKSTGVVSIKADEKLFKRMEGQHIVIVEDIYDSGLSLYELIKDLNKCNPASVKTTVLFQKMNPKNLKYNYDIDYLGFLIPDEFIIGFGMDYNEQFRQLNHLCTINQDGIDKFKST
jgi:hypoxanthine phosphoribosyltransferase